MLEIFDVWIDFTVARFDWCDRTSFRKRVESFYAVFLKISTTIIQDLYTNKVNRVKHKNIEN